MIHLQALKGQIIEIGKRMWTRGYIAANDGNISVRMSDGSILITAAGVSKGFLEPEMILQVDINGKLVHPNSKYLPSSETKMHLEAYKLRSDIKAIVHAHPPYATSFASSGIPLDQPLLPESVMTLGKVMIAEFAIPSTDEVPQSISELIKTSDVMLLSNHGALSAGIDLFSAYNKMEVLEHSAHITFNSMQLGKMNLITEEKKKILIDLRKKFNFSGRIIE